jgi:NADH-quinone oxidoreductase subunit G
VENSNLNSYTFPKNLPAQQKFITRISELQMYAGDALQRRAKSLHATQDAAKPAFYLNEVLAKKLGLMSGDQAVASQQGAELVLPVVIDNRIAEDCVLLHSGLLQTAALDTSLADVSLAKA